MTEDFRLDQGGPLERLVRRIERDLDERHFCIVFEDEIERCWPTETFEFMEREKQIQAFAESRGWNVSIHNSDSGFTRANSCFRERSIRGSLYAYNMRVVTTSLGGPQADSCSFFQEFARSKTCIGDNQGTKECEV